MQKSETTDKLFMRRALQLARLGEGRVSPNPMVGAVVVSPDGRIIGEGYHRKYGFAHAEVNAIASVKESDRHLLSRSTIYVTLEPCSHYGKTPPCAKLIVETGLKRVVIGATDPNPKVSGRGIAMIKAAGIEVETGVLKEECELLNRRFMTAHRLRRPWIQLKWAESADAFLGAINEQGCMEPVRFSTPLSRIAVHRQRSLADAILVGVNTVIADNPSLDCRYWPGDNPRPITFHSERLPEESLISQNPDTILLDSNSPLLPQMQSLYKDYGITSLMVEGGGATLASFLREGLADEIRIEKSPVSLGNHGAVKSPFAIKNTLT